MTNGVMRGRIRWVHHVEVDSIALCLAGTVGTASQQGAATREVLTVLTDVLE